MTTLDLRFQSFGQWLVQGPAPTTQHGAFWVCQCACNTQAIIHEAALAEGRARSCGCDRRGGGTKYKNLTGQQFGKWLVLAVSQKKQSRGTGTYWHCECICSAKHDVKSRDLTNLKSTSCGCNRIKVIPSRWLGRWFVLEHAGSNKVGESLWRCRCKCGNESIVRGTSLRSGVSQSCGCQQDQSMMGKWFGQLRVVEQAPSRKQQAYWRCECLCGQEAVVKAQCLRNGRTKSCGCLARTLSADRLRTWARGRREWMPDDLTFLQQFVTPAVATVEAS